MKKVLSWVLCLAMMFNLSVVAFADTTPTGNYAAGTIVSYTGTGTEAYEVTVPASLTPVAGSNSGSVTVSGKWASNRVVSVSAPASVTLTNSINSSDTKELAITFTPIAKTGDNNVAIATTDTGCTQTISVENISNALFGTWKGTFNYTVGISDAGVEEETHEAGAYWGETFLTWEELKDSANGETYGYDASAISDTSIGDYAFSECAGLTSITLPNVLTSVGDYAFECAGLTSIIIPESVEYIGEGAFAAPSLTSIVVSEGNTVYDSRENCNAIIETATNNLISGCTNAVIPSSVTSIGSHAFVETDLTSINLPDGLTNIGDGAFKTASLTSVIYKGTTYTSISELESVLASADVTLGEDIFMGSGLSA